MKVKEKCNLELVNEIPADWKVLKLKNISDLSSSGVNKKIEEGESLYKSVHYMDVYRSSGKEINNKDSYLRISATQNQELGCTLLKGDILLTSSSETPGDIGHSVLVNEYLNNTLYGYHLVRVRINPKIEIDHEYRKYILSNYYIRNYFTKQANGITRFGLSMGDFKNANIIVPPLKEQVKIANFLDHKTTLIDKTITSKEKQIELLKEQKQSIITEAVTKGLDSGVEMKDSGVEWIGEVPKDWIIGKTKDRFSTSKVKSMEETPIILSLTKNGIKIRDISKNEGQVAQSYVGYSILKKGDLVLNPMDLVSNAFVSISTFEGVISPAYTILKEKMPVDKRFFCYYYKLQYWNKCFFAHGKGVSSENRWTLNNETLSRFPTVIPPINEQREIAEYIDIKTSKIDAIIKVIVKEIEKLKEYKQSLIFEVVTGKIELS